MKPSRRIRKNICSTQVAPHWASQCKLSQGKDFASKLEPLEEKRLASIGVTVNKHEEEVEELEAYFGMASGESRAPGLAVGFALLAMGPASAKRTTMKFVMKLKRKPETSRAIKDVEDSHEGSVKARPLLDMLASVPTTASATPLPGMPQSPPGSACPSASPSPSPSPRVRDPVSPRELREAIAPVRLRRQDLEPTVPRRDDCDQGAGCHYAYFQRKLPHESPQHRAAMQKRVTEERHMQPGLIRGPQPRRLSP